ncbi:MAG TPA: 1-(5-phosphoribosyl)-5-amino-4-imidazole-carboxylate carboxylase, partial [Clostridiaceae bacterium]|nr:1-(5-phosphoribosyl)-5-amino-4-imidazole-carboxylate carboxylase [Clostridiaceae bacterium]
MNREEIKELLSNVKNGTTSEEEALKVIEDMPYRDL